MRDKKKPILLVASLCVMALAAVAPGPVSPGQSLAVSRPPVASEVGGAAPETAPAEGVEAQTAAAPEVVSDDPQVSAEAAPAKAVRTDSASVEEASDPSTWVASVDVLGTGDEAPPEPPPGDGPCPKATTCRTNVIRHQRWKTAKDGSLTIGWRFNDEGRRNLRAPEGLLESAVRASMSEWSRWNSNINFEYAGTTTASFAAKGKDGSCADGVNTITWQSFDPSLIAAVGTCIDPATNTVRDADLALNVTQHWEDISGEAESRHTFDIRSIVTHELGHILSLLDLYGAGSVRQSMMGAAEYGETRKRTLALGDIVGLQTAYPGEDGDICPRKDVVDD
jgi:hypothetical protein